MWWPHKWEEWVQIAYSIPTNEPWSNKAIKLVGIKKILTRSFEVKIKPRAFQSKCKCKYFTTSDKQKNVYNVRVLVVTFFDIRQTKFYNGVSAIALWFRLKYHPAAPGSNPMLRCFFNLYSWNWDCNCCWNEKKDEYKRKRGRDWPM